MTHATHRSRKRWPDFSGRSGTCAPRRRGFTLVEMLLVVVVIGIAASIAAPSLSGWGRGAKLRDATQSFIAATRYARSQAIAEATPYRIVVAGTGYSIQKVVDGSYVAVGTELADTALPTDFVIGISSGGVNGGVEFYPNGRTTPAVVTVRSPQNETANVVCAFPADLFRENTEAPR